MKSEDSEALTDTPLSNIQNNPTFEPTHEVMRFQINEIHGKLFAIENELKLLKDQILRNFDMVIQSFYEKSEYKKRTSIWKKLIGK